MSVYQLYTLFPVEDGIEYAHDGTFATPEAAQRWAAEGLSKDAEGPWRRQTRIKGRVLQHPRWIRPVPHRRRRGPGWSIGWVVQEDEIQS